MLVNELDLATCVSNAVFVTNMLFSDVPFGITFFVAFIGHVSGD